MVSLLAFFLLVSSGSFYAAVRFQRRYEEAVPLTIFCAVEVVFLFGLVDNLKLGFYVVCLLAAALYALGARHVLRTGAVKGFCQRFFTPAMALFAVLLVVYAFCIVGWIPYHWDSFYFWALSVKQMFFLNVFHCVPPAETLFAEYTPGMQILEYIALCLKGSYTEWRILFAYGAYLFSLFLPFLSVCRRSLLRFVLFACVVFSCGSLFYDTSLTTIYVDLTLGATFGCGLAHVFLLQREPDGRWDPLKLANLVMTANMLVLIKSAGALFAGLLLAAAGLVLFFERQRPVVWRWRTVLWLLPFFLPLATRLLWTAKYRFYQSHVYFEVSHYDLLGFVKTLLGLERDDYRTPIRDKFYTFLFQEPVSVGPLTLSNIQICLLFAALFFGLLCLWRKGSRGQKIALAVLLIGFLVYALGLMASYMYTFPTYEGPQLASMQRYLNIYYTAAAVCAVSLLMRYSGDDGNAMLRAAIVLSVLLSFCKLTTVQDLLMGNVVQTSHAVMDTIPDLAETVCADMGAVPETLSNCLLIDKKNLNGGMRIALAYSGFPYFKVLSDYSFGSVPVQEGDTATKLMDQQEFSGLVREQSASYIAIYCLDDDFIQQYSALFNAPLADGQVYRVTGNAVPYELVLT